MKISEEEIEYIASLSKLKLSKNEKQDYIEKLQDILNFANIVKNAPVEDLEVSVGGINKENVFRKDEVNIFEDNKALLENAPSKDNNMFKIPKVL